MAWKFVVKNLNNYLILEYIVTVHDTDVIVC